MKGSIVVCGTGPSFSLAQRELLYEYGATVMTVNNSYFAYPNCKYLFAADLQWWYRYYDKINFENTNAYTLQKHPEHIAKKIPKADQYLKSVAYTSEFGFWCSKVHHGGNSGYMAIQLAHLLGYTKIILVGFDCKYDDKTGKRHFFGDYDKKFFKQNADDIDRWILNFNKIAPHFKENGIDVVNCSEDTALTCFRRNTLGWEL